MELTPVGKPVGGAKILQEALRFMEFKLLPLASSPDERQKTKF